MPPELTEKGSIREGEIFGLYPGKYQPLPYGGYYTHEDVHEIVRYAAERHITVIPEIDIPALYGSTCHLSTVQYYAE